MIPDNHSMIQAVTMYITERVDYRLYRQNKISERIYMDSKKERDFYCGSAFNDMSIPNMDGMESLKNMLNNIVLGNNHHLTSFRYNNMSGTLQMYNNIR